MDLEQQLAAVTGERDELKSKLTSANAEAKGHRLSAESYRSQVEDFRGKWQTATSEIDTLKATHVTDLDKVKIDLNAQLNVANKERDDAKSSASARIADADLKVAARELGMVDLDGLKLLDRAGLKTDDDGNVTNAAELLDAMKETKPYLFGQPVKPGVVTGTTTGTGKKPAATQAPTNFDARTATKEEYAKAYAEAVRP